MLFALFFGYAYARYIEPKLIKVTQIPMKNVKIPPAFDGLRVVQFSDTHLGHDYSIAQLVKVVSKINQLSPDIVLFTGDLVDKPNQYEFLHKIAPELKKLKAPLGKYSIYGNHDHGGYGTDVYKAIMDESGFSLLKNSGKKISLLDGSFIYLAGIDDLMLGKPDYQQALAGADSSHFTLLLAHEPDAALETKKHPADWQLSGHSHGGQVQLPLYGPLITPPFASVYTEGMYEEDGLTLYVNRGLGTTRLPFRFLSVPEITVFTLKTKEKST
jgi:predicted MPP superfamily phosphohydrolase